MKSMIYFTSVISFTLAMVCVQANAANCELQLLKKTPLAKTAYLKSGDSLSHKVIKKLEDNGCTISSRLMTMEEKRQFEIKRLKTRLLKLKAGSR